MLVDISIVHAASVVPKRRRKAEDGLYGHVATVEIEEMATEECPVAFWLLHPHLKDDVQAAWRRSGDDFLLPMGGLTTSATSVRPPPWSRRKTPVPATVLGRDEIGKFFSGLVYGREGPRSFSSSDPTRGRRTDDPLPPTLEDVGGRVESSDRELLTAEVLEAVASRYVLVGDVMHLRLGPPIVKLDGYSSGIDIARADLSDLSRTAGIRYAGALRSPKEVRDAFGGRDAPPASHVRRLACEIVDEEAARFDEARHLLVLAARDLVRSASRRHNDRSGSPIADAGREAMTAFATLRDMPEEGLPTTELAETIGTLLRTAGRIEYHLAVERIVNVLRTAEDLVVEDAAPECAR